MKKYLCVFLFKAILSVVLILPVQADVMEVEAEAIVVHTNHTQAAIMVGNALETADVREELAYADVNSSADAALGIEKENSTDEIKIENVPEDQIEIDAANVNAPTEDRTVETIELAAASEVSDQGIEDKPNSGFYEKQLQPSAQPKVTKEFIGSKQDRDTLNRAQGSAVDGQPQKVSPGDSNIDVRTRNRELGFEIQQYMYHEPIFDLDIQGLMYGVFGAYTFRPYDGNDPLYNPIISMFKVEGRFNFGEMDYEATGSGTSNNIPDYTVELRALYGKDIYLGSSFMATPYFGLGWRYLNDDSAGKISSEGDAGYERESNYVYLPVGVEFTQKVAEQWTLGLTGEYDLLLWGRQKSHLSDVPGGYPDVTNDQDEGYGTKVAVRLTHVGSKINFYIEPYFRYWHIEDSDVVTATGPGVIVTGREPENTTEEMGVRVGTQF